MIHIVLRVFSLGHCELRIFLVLSKRWIWELKLGLIYVSKIEQVLLPEAFRNMNMACLFPGGQFIDSLSKYTWLLRSLQKEDG